MNIENKIKEIRTSLLKFKRKKFFSDDFQMIQNCKQLFIDSINQCLDEKDDATKSQIFNKIFNFFQLEKDFKKEEKVSFKLIIFPLLILSILFPIIIELSPLKLSLDFMSDFKILLISYLGNYLIIFAIILYLLGLINKIKKDYEKSVRINFIIDEALNELKEEFEAEAKKQFLEPIIDVKLEEAELKELLSEDLLEETYDKPDIAPRVYDRKASLERRKRRRNLNNI